MDEPGEAVETADLLDAGGESEGDGSRRKAALLILPFLAIGLFDLALLLGWGLNPLWGFLLLPPILFVSALGWIAFKNGFTDRA